MACQRSGTSIPSEDRSQKPGGSTPASSGSMQGFNTCGNSSPPISTNTGAAKAIAPTPIRRRPCPRAAATNPASSESAPTSSATPRKTRCARNSTSHGEAPSRSRLKQGGSVHGSAGASEKDGDQTRESAPLSSATTPAVRTMSRAIRQRRSAHTPSGYSDRRVPMASPRIIPRLGRRSPSGAEAAKGGPGGRLDQPQPSVDHEVHRGVRRRQ